jgi:hypothetical protein
MFYCTIFFVSRILTPQKSFHFHFTMSLLAMNLMFIYQTLHQTVGRLFPYTALHYTAVFSFVRGGY